jgi:transcriptional regulator with XRE-family HTH domain
MNQEKIGNFIAVCRKEQKLTQRELAEKLGVSDRAVSKWENGNNLPDLSLFKPLCDELKISINEFLSGERIEKDKYALKLEENIVNTIDYSNKKINKVQNIIGTVFISFGILIILTALTIFPSSSSWGSVYSVFGVIISLIGISRFSKKLSYPKRVMINFGYFIVLIAFLFTIDFLNVKLNKQVPRFCLNKLSIDNVAVCETPFYNFYRCNLDADNEYGYIDKRIDVKKIDFEKVCNKD